MHPSNSQTMYCLQLFLYHLSAGTDNSRMLPEGDSSCSIVKSVCYAENSSFGQTFWSRNCNWAFLPWSSALLQVSMISLSLPWKFHCRENEGRRRRREWRRESKEGTALVCRAWENWVFHPEMPIAIFVCLSFILARGQDVECECALRSVELNIPSLFPPPPSFL